MRSAALAEAWLEARLGDVIFWGEISLEYVIARLQRIGSRVVETRPAESLDAVVICDHYDADVRAGIAGQTGSGIRVLVDDLGGVIPSGFDIVWNPNAYATAALYPKFGGKVLSGPKYIPLRSDIPRWKRAGARGTAVMLGGSGAIPAALRAALADLAGETSLKPVAGVGSWLPSGWAELSTDSPWSDIVGHQRLVTAAGTTTWEAAKAGIPVVALLLADNQSKIFEWAVGRGAPGIDVRRAAKGTLGPQLVEAARGARKLPTIENGARRVRDYLRDNFDKAQR